MSTAQTRLRAAGWRFRSRRWGAAGRPCFLVEVERNRLAAPPRKLSSHVSRATRWRPTRFPVSEERCRFAANRTVGGFGCGSDECPELAKGSKVGRVFGSEPLRLSYEDGFGSTAALQARTSEAGTALFVAGSSSAGRNKPIGWSCEKCSVPATVVCPYCIYEGGLSSVRLTPRSTRE
jgi:hypothetical protein